MAGHIKRRRYANGTVRWRARYPDPLKGGTAQIERTFNTKREAEGWLDDLKHSARTGLYIDPGQAQRTFADVAQEWRTTWTDLEPKTKAGYDSILKGHVLPRFGKARVGAITSDAVQRFINELAADRAPNTVRRIYSVVRGVLALAVERRYLAAKPADPVRLPKKASTKQERIYLTAAEVHALATATAAHWRVAVYVAAYIGLRAGELWALRRRDIDLLRGELHVRRALKDINTTSTALTPDEKGLILGPTKTPAERKVSIPAPIRPLLQEHLAQHLPGGDGPDGLVFTTPNGYPVRHGLFYRRVFRPAVEAALPPHKHRLRWHDLRHTCAALSLSVSPNLQAVQARLGHDDIRTTINVYGHLLPSVDEALSDGLGRVFEEAQAAQSNVAPLRG